ncbi:CCA tRNA nucleotidyltransferase [Xanthobacter sp. TB0139]|uniref:CCA tRNA nucleotidyltransferase n=1 Tax=Xanthobacter sp. TB0139 TaxID=3459178 RepID=UPI0040391164
MTDQGRIVPGMLADAAFWARPGLGRLLALLNRDGEEARVVGGAVRNALMGLEVADVDIATTALPQEVVRRTTAAGMKAVPTGLAHGTITVVVEHTPYEVTTLREDAQTDGRHAEVVFGRDWARDAARRDFTINALYATPDGTVRDLVGGLADIPSRHVRFIGDAHERIREDYLRILRLFRFHATYGAGAVDVTALRACEHERAGLVRLSRERVGAEMRKLLIARGAVSTLQTMSDSGLLQPLLGGIGALARLRRLVTLETEWGAKADAMRHLGALALWTRADALRLRERLRLSNTEARQLDEMAGPVPDLAGASARRAFFYAVGQQAAQDRALLAAARFDATESTLRHLREAFHEAGDWVRPRLPVTAADLMAQGLKPGPDLGRALKQVEQAWVEADFPMAPDVLARLVAQELANLSMSPERVSAPG